MEAAELLPPGRRDDRLRQIDVDERRAHVAPVRSDVEPEEHVVGKRDLQIERQRRLQPVEIGGARTRRRPGRDPQERAPLLEGEDLHQRARPLGSGGPQGHGRPVQRAPVADRRHLAEQVCRAGGRPQLRDPRRPQVADVAGEQLVGAVPGEHRSVHLPQKSRHGEQRRVRERLAGLGDQGGKVLRRPVHDAQLMVLGSEALRDPPRQLQVLVASGRIGADPAGKPGHQGDERARVESSGEQGRRPVGEPPPDCLLQARAHRDARGPAPGTRQRRLEPAVQARAGLAEPDQVSGRHLAHRAPGRAWRRNIAELQIVRESRAVDLAARRCFWRARPEPDLLAGDAVVERLSSEGIARQQQGPRLLVPEGYRERAAQAVQRAFAVLGKETLHLVGADFPGEQQTLLDFPGQIEVSVHALGPSG